MAKINAADTRKAIPMSWLFLFTGETKVVEVSRYIKKVIVIPGNVMAYVNSEDPDQSLPYLFG